MLTNTYIVCLPKQSRTAPFDPFNYQQADYPGFIEIDYLAGAFRTLERDSDITGLTVYITWNVRELPTYGNQVVVVLMGDEWGRFPNYMDKVRMVFRAHSNQPIYTGNLAGGFSYQNLVAFLQYVSLHLRGFLGRLIPLAKQYPHLNKRQPKAHIIPLGYANQLKLPIVPFEERTTDLSFMGSVTNHLPPKTSLRFWIKSPKTVARKQMLKNARDLQQKRPELAIYLKSIKEFTGNLFNNGLSIEDEKFRYSSELMNTKICLVPRGSSLETFRLFEAMRYGCIAICDRLPDRWYYAGLPAIQIDHWDELECIVEALINNPERMQQLHQAAQIYWHTVCSESMLGHFIIERLTSTDTFTTSSDDALVSSSTNICQS